MGIQYRSASNKIVPSVTSGSAILIEVASEIWCMDMLVKSHDWSVPICRAPFINMDKLWFQHAQVITSIIKEWDENFAIEVFVKKD